MEPIQYRPVMAIDAYESDAYADIPLYWLQADGIYAQINYFNTSHEGTTYVGGGYDIDTVNGHTYEKVSLYHYLYTVDQDACPHNHTNLIENCDQVEYVCKTCGKRIPAPLAKDRPEFTKLIRRLTPEAQAAFRLWEAESTEYARFCKEKAPELANWDSTKAILTQAKEILDRAEKARQDYFNLIGMK